MTEITVTLTRPEALALLLAAEKRTEGLRRNTWPEDRDEIALLTVAEWKVRAAMDAVLRPPTTAGWTLGEMREAWGK